MLQGRHRPAARATGLRAVAVLTLAAAAVTVTNGVAQAAPQFTLERLVSGPGPSAVATGDLNGDGLPDVVVVERRADRIAVRLGVGGGALGAPSTYAVGDAPSAVAIGDLNGDRVLDLAVADRGSDDVATLINRGDGTFAGGQRLPLPAGSAPSTVAIGSVPDPDGTSPDAYGDVLVTTPGTGDAQLLYRDASGAVRRSFALDPPGAAPIAGSIVSQPLTRERIDLASADGLTSIPVAPAAAIYDCDTQQRVLLAVVPTLSDSCATRTGVQDLRTDGDGGALNPTDLVRLDDPNAAPGTAGRAQFAVLRPGAVSIATTATPDLLAISKTLPLPATPTTAAAGRFDTDLDLAVGYGDRATLSLLAAAGPSFDRLDVDGPGAGAAIAATDLDDNDHADLLGAVEAGDVVGVLHDRWPGAQTGAAASAGNAATLSGTGDGRGLPGTYRFVVRATGSPFATQTAPTVLPADGVISAPVGGLPSGATFTYQLAVTTDAGTRYGQERTFTTAPDTVTPAAPGTVPALPPFPSVRAEIPAPPSNAFTLRGATTASGPAVAIALPGPGTVRILGNHLRTQTLRRPAAGTATVAVRLTTVGRRLLTRRHRLRLRVSVRFQPTGGEVRELRTTCTFTTKRGSR